MCSFPSAAFSAFLAMGAALVLSVDAWAQGPAEIRPPKYQLDGWLTACWPGTDGFAANCRAHKRVDDLVLRLAVGDGQFVQYIDHPGCASPAPYSVFRDELFRLSESRRRRLVIGNFTRMALELSGTCAQRPRLGRADVGSPPDIALAGEKDLG